MDETPNVINSNNPGVVLGPPPGYPAEPQFSNPAQSETLTNNPHTNSTQTNNTPTNNNSIPTKPAKVLIKNTFITIRSDTPPSTTRYRTFSADAIRLGSGLANYSPEYVIPNNFLPPQEYTIKQPFTHNVDGNKSNKNDHLTPEDNPINVPNMIINSTPNSPNSHRDSDDLESTPYSSIHTPSIPYYQPTPAQTLHPQVRHSSPLYSQNEAKTHPINPNNTNLYPLQDENDTTKLNYESENMEFFADELYKHRFKHTHNISPISPDNKFETKPIDPNLVDIVRDPKLRVAEPDILARQLANQNITLSGLPICNNGFSTVMLRNIPNKYTQSMMMNVIDEFFRFLYDFFYLPIDFRNKCNVGYAFINFIHPYFAELFWQKFDNFKLNAFKSNKVCAVTWGRVQGLKANIEHYRNSAVMSMPYAEYKPMLFENGVEVPWPSSNRPIPEVKLRTKKN